MAKKSKYYVRTDGLHEAIRVINGKRIYFRGATDGEVERKMIAYRGEVERGRLFKDIAEEWKDIHFPTLAPNTLRGYNPAFKRAVKAFGDVPLKSIKTPDIKGYLNTFVREKRSRKTVTNQKLMLNLIFSYGVECGETEYNPCTYASIPKNLPKGRREAATPADEQAIKHSADVWIFPFLVLYTGLRKGEALALTYDDFDWVNMRININKSVYHQNNHACIKKPKTPAGVRSVPILAPLAEKLTGKKGAQYVFSEDGGKTPLTEMQYQKQYYNFCKQTGVSATAHQLRHSYATMLLDCDIGVKDAQDLLGHSTVAMTQDIYTHIRDKRRESTAIELDLKLAALEDKNAE